MRDTPKGTPKFAQLFHPPLALLWHDVSSRQKKEYTRIYTRRVYNRLENNSDDFWWCWILNFVCVSQFYWITGNRPGHGTALERAPTLAHPSKYSLSLSVHRRLDSSSGRGLAVCTKIKFITIKSFAIRDAGGDARWSGKTRGKKSLLLQPAVCAQVEHRLSSRLNAPLNFHLLSLGREYARGTTHGWEMKVERGEKKTFWYLRRGIRVTERKKQFEDSW